jgi:hypothetical protein
MLSGHASRHCWTTVTVAGFVGCFRAVGRFLVAGCFACFRAVGRFRVAVLLFDFRAGFFFAMSFSFVEFSARDVLQSVWYFLAVQTGVSRLGG